MTQDDTPTLYPLSRRKMLGGLGAIGLASAGAGLGTSAFFSDEETFQNNVLTAGELDLVVDWEEHYYTGGLSDVRLEYSEPTGETADAYVGFPDPEFPHVYVHEADIGAFMDATSIEAYPDLDDDGVQDELEGFVSCEDFAQLDANLDPTNGRGAGKRSLNEDTVTNLTAVLEQDADADWKPLVSLDDVKPGDFGELTLSLHLCDNPGYLWLQGELRNALENGHTDPEANADLEVGAPDSTNPADVELLDGIQTLLWYDEDGDNVFEPGAGEGGDADIVLIMDTSDSMGGSPLAEAKTDARALVDAVGPAARIALIEFNYEEALLQELTTDKTVIKGAIDGLTTASGTSDGIEEVPNTNIEGGINGARDVLTGTDVSNEIDPSILADSTTPNIPVLFSDGAANVDDETAGGSGNANSNGEATALKDDGVELYTIAYGENPSAYASDLMEAMASEPTAEYAYLAAEFDQVEASFAQIGQTVGGEQAIFRGSLRELLTAVGTDFGIPLDGVRSTPYDELTEPPTAQSREEFVNSTNDHVGLAWWLPLDTGNEIQSDSVSFDLGFYVEQSRHNDGSGQAPATTIDQ